MRMKVAQLAFLVCLTGTSAVAVGQSNSSTSATDPQGAGVYKAAGHTDNHSGQDEIRSDCGKKKHKEKNKRDAKPTPSQQEQEFEKVLQGIHG